MQAKQARLRTGALLIAALATLASARAPAQSSEQRLQHIVDDYFDAALALTPTRATLIGDHRFDDALERSATQSYYAERSKLAQRARERAAALDERHLDGESRLTLQFLRDEADVLIAGARFPQHLLPLDHVQSVPELVARLGSGAAAQPFVTIADYDRFLARLRKLPDWMADATMSMREGMRLGVTHPRAVMERLPPVLLAIGTAEPSASAFWKPIEALPEQWPARERERITTQYREELGQRVLPAYRRLAKFITDDYLPAARTTVAWTALPDGDRWYRYKTREATTLQLDPDTVHATGLAEVARIQKEMERVRAQLGFEGDLAAFLAQFQNDPKFFFDSSAAALTSYRELKPRIDARLPELFGRLPRTDYEIRPFEAFRAAQVPGGQYQRGAPDGSRRGVFYINTENLRALPNYITETLTLHEASPGHHFQVTIAQELTGLPRLRRFGQLPAFQEGWALYAESLGPELGLYGDPLQWYGHLTDGILRAMRLVVDTGLHTRGWSREQAVQYMLSNSSVTPATARVEVDRYIVWPGQALAYKHGELQIRALRERARKTLGARFDIRAFHDQVLGSGPLPLTVLDAKIGAWLESQRSR